VKRRPRKGERKGVVETFRNLLVGTKTYLGKIGNGILGKTEEITAFIE
jgi:hypothetical protein